MQSINSSVNNMALGTSNNVSISSARVQKSADTFTGKQATETQTVESKNKKNSVEQALTSKKQTQKNAVKQNQENQSSQLNQSAQSKQNFELDEKTIAFLEKHRLESTQSQSTQSQSTQFQNSQVQKDQVPNQVIPQDDSRTDFANSSEFIAKDQVSFQNQTAVSSYQRINNLAQRESVQQLLGIDLYA